MADVFTRRKRSEVMALIRSRGNKDTELRLAAGFREAGITGWRRHLPLSGRPDFTFRKARLVVFVDGCFWHGCRRHGTWPKNNAAWWLEKITKNRSRDRDTDRRLRRSGWTVARVWAHEAPAAAARRISGLVRRSSAERTCVNAARLPMER